MLMCVFGCSFPVIVEASDNDRPPVTATTTVVVTVRVGHNH